MGKKKKYWVGFDLGGTKMMAKVFDGNFKELSRVKKKTKAQEGQDAGVYRIEQLIEQAVEKADVKLSDISGIGLGAPGILDLDSGVVIELFNLGWSNVPIKDRLVDRFGCNVVIANDVDAGVYGEYRFGAAQDAHCVLGVFPGTGIGGGCVYNGEIVRGKNISVMEFGHMQIVSDGPLCGCGQRGCIEALASRLAVASAASAAAFRGEAPVLLEKCGTELSKMRSGALADSIAGGDKAIEHIVREAARWLGVGVGNVLNLLGPDLVVLGGGMVEAMPDLFVEEVSAAAKDRAVPALKKSFKVVAAKLADEATAMGAAAMVCHSMQG